MSRSENAAVCENDLQIMNFLEGKKRSKGPGPKGGKEPFKKKINRPDAQAQEESNRARGD